jgi:hypothetical protein
MNLEFFTFSFTSIIRFKLSLRSLSKHNVQKLSKWNSWIFQYLFDLLCQRPLNYKSIFTSIQQPLRLQQDFIHAMFLLKYNVPTHLSQSLKNVKNDANC